MNTKKVATEYRLSQWAQIIQKRMDSGQSIKDFCQLEGIRRNKYFYWQRKLREAACTEIAKQEEPENLVPNGWAKIAPAPAQQMKATLDIEIGGCHITANSETDLELLKKVCHTLRSL